MTAENEHIEAYYHLFSQEEALPSEAIEVASWARILQEGCPEKQLYLVKDPLVQKYADSYRAIREELIVDQLIEAKRKNQNLFEPEFTGPIKAHTTADNTFSTVKYDVEIARLKSLLHDLSRHLNGLSVRKRYSAYSVVAITICSLLTLGVMMWGEVKFISPWPQVSLVLSLLFFIMARLVPEPKLYDENTALAEHDR